MPAPSRAATPSLIRMTDEHRSKIANSQILNKLIAHVEGNQEMSATQVTAALGLLKKALPDLQSIALTDGDGNALTINLTYGGK